MKKFSTYLLSLLALAAPMLLTSCGDDDEDPTPARPSISLRGDNITGQASYDGFPGERLSFDVNVTAPGGFNTLRVEKLVNGVSDTTFSFSRTPGATVTSFDTTVVYEIPTADQGNTVIYRFTATDDLNQSSENDFTINVRQSLTTRYSTVLLSVPIGTGVASTSETFFSTNNGETYSMNDVLATQQQVSPLIDFGYFFGPAFQATLASPADYPFEFGQAGWSVRNETLLRRTNLTAAQFDLEAENNVDLINNAFTNGTVTTGTSGPVPGQVRSLGVGQVVAFELVQTKGRRRGLAKVEALTTGTGTNGSITLEIIVVR